MNVPLNRQMEWDDFDKSLNHMNFVVVKDPSTDFDVRYWLGKANVVGGGADDMVHVAAALVTMQIDGAMQSAPMMMMIAAVRWRNNVLCPILYRIPSFLFKKTERRTKSNGHLLSHCLSFGWSHSQ